MPVSATQHLLDWLVVSPSRPRPDPALFSQAEWDTLIAESVAHTTAPLLFRVLTAESRKVPPTVLQCAFMATLWQKRQTSNLERDLSSALRALNAVNITPILLKGAHVATMIYPEISDRPMADIDLLVPLDQMATAEEALMALGYTSERTKSMEDWCGRSREIQMLKPDAMAVELHWALTNPRDPMAVDHDGLWRRSNEVSMFGHTARVLSLEDLVLYISYHAVISHQFGEKGLRPLFDILAILQRHGQSINWGVVEQRARQWHIERATYLMLQLARQEGDAPIPDDLLSRLKPHSVSSVIYNAARAQMFEAPGVRLHPVIPVSIALAWVSPKSMWNHLFARRNCKQETVGSEMGMYVARYGRFLWHCLLHDRSRLLVIFKRVWRHLVLSHWLADERSTAGS